MWILSIPAIQHKISRIASEELTQILGTQTTLKRVHIRPMDRIVLDEVSIADQAGVDMLQIERLAVQYDFLSLIRGKINVHGVQLFSPQIHLIQDSISGKMNYDFLLKLFGKGGSGNKVHLRINSLLIRRGQIQMDPQNVHVDNLATRLSIKTITEDSIDVRIKSLSLRAQEKFEINNLRLECLANRHGMKLRKFGIELPNTAISSPSLTITYDSLKHLGQPQKWKHVQMSLDRGSHITPIDLHAFVPQLQSFTHPWALEGQIEGNAEKLYLQGGIHVPTLVELAGEATVKNLAQKEKANIHGSLTQGLITNSGLSLLAHELSLNKVDSARFTNLKQVRLQGAVDGPLQDCTLKGRVQTVPGNLDLLLQAQIANPTHREVIASISSDSIALGTILGDSTFGNTAMDINVRRAITHKKGSKQAPSIEWAVQGDIHELSYKSYLYQNITVDVSGVDKNIQGELWADDPNGSLWINGNIDMRPKLPQINFEASLENIHLDHLNLSKRAGAEFSSHVKLQCAGLHPDSIRGSLHIPSLHYRSEGHDYQTKDITLSAETLPQDSIKSKLPNRKIQLRSDFLQLDLAGHFAFRDVVARLKNQLFANLSSLYPVKEYPANNQHQYDLRVSLDKSDFIEDVLEIPFKLQGASSLHLVVDEHRNTSTLNAYLPRAIYGRNTFQSVNVMAVNMPNKTFADVRLNKIRRGRAINVALHTEAHEDSISTALNWGNNSGATYSGRIDMHTLLTRHIQPQAVTTIQPTQIIIQDSIWDITPATVTWRPQYIDVDDLRISHKEQLLAVRGTASSSSDDRIDLQLIDMDLKYIFSMVNLTRSVDFGGMATGHASMAHAFKTPELNADLVIKKYSYNDAVLGDLDIQGRWDPKEKGIHLQASCFDKKDKVFTTNGYIYPIGIGGLDLSFKAYGINIGFMQYYLSSISSDVQGQAWGDIRVFGPFNGIDLEGDLNLSGETNINILGTRYKLGLLDKDEEKSTARKPVRRVQANRLLLTPGRIETRQFAIHDMENHPGTVNLTLTHKHLGNMKYDVRLESQGMLVLDTKTSDSVPFSGHVYASGSGRIYGQHNELHCEAGLRSQRNSTFEFVLQESESAYEAPFITFRDARTTWRKQPKKAEEKTAKTSDTDIYLDIQVDATPDVQMKLIMDPQVEDNIVGTGNGNVRLTYHNKGDVNMYGRYTIRQGRYDFSLQDVIHKTFDINQGSSITFDGDPLQGNMDIQATYVVNGASLADLGSDVSNLVDNPNVRVHCLLNLDGAILSPEIDMDIALPNERAEIERMVRNYIGTDEQMDMQIIYLLSLGKFYTQLEDDDQNQGSNMVTSVISSTLSGQLNSMISGLTNNHWNFGTNLSTGQNGWTDMEIEGMLSGRLLNNRLLINGNFGYRESATSETNFIGDFDVQYLLTRSGNIILKAYNKTNDHYYTRNSLTTQGVGIVLQKDFNKWDWLWFWKKKKKNVSLQTKVQKTNSEDSFDAFNATSNDSSNNKSTEDQSTMPNLEFDFIKYE